VVQSRQQESVGPGCEERAHWLSDEHGLSHGYASAIVHEYERQRRIRLNYA
jgi:predicted neutral ceramidase superfamily lipid hydrolase